MRIITNLDELDEVLAECERAAQISDHELRRVFETFRMDISAQLPPDPFCAEYTSAQMALYERIAGRRYSTGNEESIFDVDTAVLRPFPYTASCQVAGTHLGAIGFLLRSMQLQPGARVLDVGAGWGNTTLALAQLGFEVTALDIEPRFCKLISERTRRGGVQVEVINDDFFWIEKVARGFDAIVFFESFHHCADHLRLLRTLGQALAYGGHVYFGAEPIPPDFPVPWGLRTDGESLWAIRRNGWLELGFQPGYFRRALRRAGLIAVSHTSADLPWINIWDAKVAISETIQIAASDPRLATQTGVRENGAICLYKGRPGYALYGPYVPLPKGRYLGRVHFSHDLPPKGKGVIDVCADASRKIFAQAPFDTAKLLGEERCVQIEFELDCDQKDIELRLNCARGFSGCIERVELVDRMAQLLDQQALSLSETKRSLHAENIGQERDSRECAPLSDRPSETERLSYAKVIGELPPPEHPPAAPRADDRGFILDIYRGLLGRDPDEVGMHDFSDTLRNGSLDRVGVIKAILSSTEFKSRRIGAVQYQGHESPGCLRSEAEAVFGRFKKHKGSGRPGFVTNFLGGSTDVRFVHGIESLSGVVEGYPIPGNFHGDTLEWVGTLRSALDASSTFTMLELGAGWAPWCVIGYLAAKHRGIQKIKLIGVEGDAGHIKFIRESFAANGIGPDIGKAIHGVVGVADGEADFPKATDASRVYGGAAAFSETDKAGGAFADFSASQSALVEQVDNLPCFSLMTLMRDFDQVDLIHCDIQGAEANLFTQMIEPVSEKVKRIVVGTHSFEIDRRLACVFAKHSWDLEGMNACVMREDSGKPVIVHDGVQVWRNMRF